MFNPNQKPMQIMRTLTLLLLAFHSLSQRGANAENTSHERHSVGNTYALVIGVSKYKNPNIPELKFADVDALVFREYLLSSGVPEQNVYTLINENATNASFWSTLNFLADQVKDGDQVYIYFSGHGDVENKTIVQDAYLLPYDSPHSVYPMGAIGIVYLKSWIATFSSRGVQTIFIADACKSGNLIGGREGMEATANVLKDKWQDEIKIVSCQPGELSLEGDQWGGGRGLFSFELINGLSGMADKNSDGQVSLRELNLYLLDKVPEQSGRNPQNPMLFGDYESTISAVNREFLKYNSDIDELKLSKDSKVDRDEGKPVLTKGILSELDQTSNQTSANLLREMADLIEKNLVISGSTPNAYAHYQLLKKEKADQKLIEAAKLMLSEKMLRDIQNFVLLIIGDISEEDYGPVDISRLSLEATLLRDLLGDQNLRESGNLARVLFGEACRSLKKFIKDERFIMPKELALSKLDTALTYDPGAVYVNLLKGMILEFEAGDKKAALVEYTKAVDDNPNFRIARNMLLMRLLDNKDYRSIISYTNITKQSDLDVMYAYMAYKRLDQVDSARIYFVRIQSMSHKPLDPYKEYEICSEIGEFLLNARDLENATVFLNKAVESLQRDASLHPEDDGPFLDQFAKDYSVLNYNLACNYSLIQDTERAVKHLEIAVNAGWNDFGWLLTDSDLENARGSKKFWETIAKNPFWSYNTACQYAKSGNTKEAFKHLNNALEAGFNDFTWIMDDPDLESIRVTKQFKRLMSTYDTKVPEADQ
jgi:tetratricopeptide (TPR) repeat protein